MSRHVRSPDQSDFGTSRSMILFRVSDSDPERVLRICHPVRVSPLDLCTSLIRSARSSSAFLIQYPMGRWGLFLSDMVPGIICSFNDGLHCNVSAIGDATEADHSNRRIRFRTSVIIRLMRIMEVTGMKM